MKKQLENLSGYKLLNVVDLGSMCGTCQRDNCNHTIRYEFHIEHPDKGRKTVGSTCIEHLSVSDQNLGLDKLQSLKKIAKIVTYNWYENTTQKGFKYQSYSFDGKSMRVYLGKYNSFGIQVITTVDGKKVYSEIENIKGTLQEAKIKVFQKLQNLNK